MQREPDPAPHTGAKSPPNRSPGRPFEPGNPGKPKGTRHKVTLAIEALLDGEAEALTRRAIEMALAGDMTALKLCLDRLAPPRRDRHIAIDLPPVRTAADATVASGKITDAVAAGEITPAEGAEVAKIIEAHVKNLEARDFEERLARLEERGTR